MNPDPDVDISEQLYDIVQELTVGAEFSSFEDFEKSLEHYENTNYVRFYKKHSKLLETYLKKLCTEKWVNKELLYSELYLHCVHGGTNFKSVAKERRRGSLRCGCDASIQLALSEDGANLVIKDMIEDHSHPISKEAFESLSASRRLDHESKKAMHEMFDANMDNRTILSHLQATTGKKVKLKDIQNARYRRSEAFLARPPPKPSKRAAEIDAVPVSDAVPVEAVVPDVLDPECIQVDAHFTGNAVLEKAIEQYERQTFTQYYKSSTRTVANWAKRRTEDVIDRLPAGITSVEMDYSCIHGGRRAHSKSKNIRQIRTFRLECPAMIRVRLTSDYQYLYIKDINDEHNHECSEALWRRLPRQRRLSPGETAEVERLLVAGFSSADVLDHIRDKFGKYTNVKDLGNVRLRIRQQQQDQGETTEDGVCTRIIKQEIEDEPRPKRQRLNPGSTLSEDVPTLALNASFKTTISLDKAVKSYEKDHGVSFTRDIKITKETRSRADGDDSTRLVPTAISYRCNGATVRRGRGRPSKLRPASTCPALIVVTRNKSGSLDVTEFNITHDHETPVNEVLKKYKFRGVSEKQELMNDIIKTKIEKTDEHNDDADNDYADDSADWEDSRGQDDNEEDQLSRTAVSESGSLASISSPPHVTRSSKTVSANKNQGLKTADTFGSKIEKSVSSENCSPVPPPEDLQRFTFPKSVWNHFVTLDRGETIELLMTTAAEQQERHIHMAKDDEDNVTFSVTDTGDTPPQDFSTTTAASPRSQLKVSPLKQSAAPSVTCRVAAPPPSSMDTSEHSYSMSNQAGDSANHVKMESRVSQPPTRPPTRLVINRKSTPKRARQMPSERPQNLCEVCNIIFANFNGLKQHYEDHLKKITCLCNDCGVKLPTISQFQYHKCVVADALKTCQFCCVLCNNLFPTSKDYRQHHCAFYASVCGEDPPNVRKQLVTKKIKMPQTTTISKSDVEQAVLEVQSLEDLQQYVAIQNSNAQRGAARKPHIIHVNREGHLVMQSAEAATAGAAPAVDEEGEVQEMGFFDVEEAILQNELQDESGTPYITVEIDNSMCVNGQ